MSWAQVMNNPNPTRIWAIMTVIPVFTIIPLIVVCLRMWIRQKMRGLWWDDWFILISMALAIACSVDLFLQIPYGFGTHIYELPKTIDFSISMKDLLLAQLFYFTCIGTVKISILFFILRLDRNLRHYVYAMFVFVTLLTIATDLGTIFQCTPVAFAWDFTIPGGYCMKRSAFWESIAAFNIFSDVIIFILPIKSLWNVQLPRSQRIVLVFLFAIGFFVVLTEVFRLTTLKSPDTTQDPTWDNTPVGLWSVVEYGVGIVVASAPALKPLFGKWFGSETTSNNRSYGKTSGGNSTSGFRSKFSNNKSPGQTLQTYDLEAATNDWQNKSSEEEGKNYGVMGSVSPWSGNSSREDIVREKREGVIMKSTNVTVSRSMSPCGEAK